MPQSNHFNTWTLHNSQTPTLKHHLMTHMCKVLRVQKTPKFTCQTSVQVTLVSRNKKIMPNLVQHDLDNQQEENEGRTMSAASYPPTRFGYQSQPINSQTKYVPPRTKHRDELQFELVCT